MGKVDEQRAYGIALDLYEIGRPPHTKEVQAAILAAVKEHEEWLMGEVCSGCGETVGFSPSWTINKHYKTGYCGEKVARAEWLRRQGGKLSASQRGVVRAESTR